MNFLFHSLRRWLPHFAVLTMASIFSGCAFEPGTPVAAVTVRANSSFEVMDAVERVFNEAGYRVSGHSYGSVTFDREGSKADRVIHGNWMGGDVSQRAQVAVVEKGDGKFRVRCTPLIVRDVGQGDFEDAHRRAQLVSFHYSHLLREVKRALE